MHPLTQPVAARTEFSLVHALEPHLLSLGQFKRRRQLRKNPLFQTLRPEIERVMHGMEWQLDAEPSPVSRSYLRAVAWNIERGKRFHGIREFLLRDPLVSGADLLLLTETDIGMARSGNRNVARELARALGMSYVYANGYLLLTPGDKGEREHAFPTGLSLHGNALLSRHPITRFEGIALPEFRDRFEAFEKRLGQKRAIVAEVLVRGTPITVAVVHTDPFSPRSHRAHSVQKVLAAVERYGNHRVILGGDLNTNTYDLGSPLRLSVDALHKGLRFGFHGTLDHYMSPERYFERRLFRALHDHRLRVEGVNDFTRGTIYYDTRDPALRAKARQYMPKQVLSWLDRRLEPWGGIVPLRVDWFAVRGLAPSLGNLPNSESAAAAITRPTIGGELLSDHDPIITDLMI